MASVHRLHALAGLTAAALFCLGASPAHAAGGLSLLEVGTRDVGLAGAGYAARAEDASTVLTNPAGMVRIEGRDLVLGVQAVYGDVKFSPNANTTVSGNDGGTAVGWVPGGSAFYVHSLSSDLKLGIAMAGNFGLAASWDEDWVGRYYAQESALMGVTLAPSVAFRVSDRLSFGLSLNAMYGYFNAEARINNALPAGIGDGNLKYKDEAWGFGATVGVLYQLAPGTRLGATYTSENKLDFSATPDFWNLGTVGNSLQAAGLIGRPLDTSVRVPQAVMASLYHELGPGSRWTVLANLGWQDWSQFGKVDIGLTTSPPTSLTTQSKFKDTWHAAVGAQYALSDAWALYGGVAYDSSMVDDADRSVTLPVGEGWTFGFGSRYKMRPGYDVSFGYALKWAGDLTVDNDRGPLAGRVAGEYGNTALHVMSVTFHWSF